MLSMSADNRRISVSEHVLFTLAGAAILWVTLFLLRLFLLIYNFELIRDIPLTSIIESFFNGSRFDLRVVAYLSIPLTLSLCSQRAMMARRILRLWLHAVGSLLILLGMIELDFYREFHQRLNSLVFQYLQEDPSTVLSMLWNGFPVLRLLLAWATLSTVLYLALIKVDRMTRWCNIAVSPTKRVDLSAQLSRHGGFANPFLVLFVFIIVSVIAARGTFRQGPPLRWGDAFTTEYLFTNHLGLNGALTLYDAAKNQLSGNRDNIWTPTMDANEAVGVTRQLLLTDHDQIVDADKAVIRRTYQVPEETVLPVTNVVVILMESFAGHYVGALGSQADITPNFDKLAEEGLLFRRFFSNGTHTHQGMFATMACFPNLPGFEYLMQMPEGSHQFSGLSQLLKARGYNDLYVYNGDFAWDNQSGFFSNQGMTNFIGRNDYVNPVLDDPTWGVSDQDMFDRAAEELLKQDTQKPFYAFLQTLSNHTPYALPKELPVDAVHGHGSFDEHLTAMRYSDWALGQFFEKAKKSPYYKNTLFVIVGDHGFGANEQLTEMDLHRYHVPMLMIAPGIHERFGSTIDTVGTQVDIVPSIMGRLGGVVQHQCWGRDLLSLPPSDSGFGIIKPSGSDQTVSIITGEHMVIQPKNREPQFYQYHLGEQPKSKKVEFSPEDNLLLHQLTAFIETATNSLISNTTGVDG
ncbi:MAG: LTA synthase family protein [Porticoccus sp.]|nr:LTA synthase family protein [Porticoccus sp.]